MKLICYFTVSVALLFLWGCQSKSERTVEIGDVAWADGNTIQSLTPSEPAIQIDQSYRQFDLGPLKEFSFDKAENFWRLTLDECIRSALENSEVVRDLGGTILRTPDLMNTSSDPAISYTDPNFGEEAALAAFDAQLTGQLLYQKNDRAFNSTFVGNLGQLTQDLYTQNIGLAKQSATGAIYRLNTQIVYDRNNTPSNRFADDQAFDTFLEAEIRQPLLQGAGVQFNRIAGPNNLPGVNNGVLIARANTDISLANFELGIRDLVSDVENAYWDLYFAYRDLETKIEARNGAYKIWESLQNQKNIKSATEIFQAKEQYYRFAADVQDAIHGRLNDGTRTNNGSGSGTFRANGGVRVAERRLRLIAGLPLNGGQLIVPAESPIDAQVVFDWTQSKDDALIHRTELRRQRWVIQRSHLEYLANRNHLLPSVDLISRYRVRGFGNNLYGDVTYDPSAGAAAQNGTSSLATLLQGDLQEWEIGLDVNVPIGFRRENAAVRNALLTLQREKVVLREQERQIVYGLSNSLGELERTTGLLDVNKRRLKASKEQYRAIQEVYKNDDTTIDQVLDAQRRVIESKRQFFQTQVEFMLAVKSVHFEKGTLMSYHNVAMTEDGWRNDDYEQAQRRESLKSRPINYYIPGLHIGDPKMETVEYIEMPIADTGETELPTLVPGETKLADPDQFLQQVAQSDSDVGALRMMAVELKDREERSKPNPGLPFQSMLKQLSDATWFLPKNLSHPKSLDNDFEKYSTHHPTEIADGQSTSPQEINLNDEEITDDHAQKIPSQPSRATEANAQSIETTWNLTDKDFKRSALLQPVRTTKVTPPELVPAKAVAPNAPKEPELPTTARRTSQAPGTSRAQPRSTDLKTTEKDGTTSGEPDVAPNAKSVKPEEAKEPLSASEPSTPTSSRRIKNN